MNNQNTRMSQSLPSTNPPPTITGIVQTQFLLVFGQAGVEVNLTIAWERRTSAVSHRVSVSPGRTNLIMRNGIKGCVTHGVEDKQGYWIRPRRKQKKHPSQRIEFPIKFLEFVICSEFVKHYSGLLGCAPFEIQSGIVEMQKVFNPSHVHKTES